jgi:hypothetical protein
LKYFYILIKRIFQIFLYLHNKSLFLLFNYAKLNKLLFNLITTVRIYTLNDNYLLPLWTFPNLFKLLLPIILPANIKLMGYLSSQVFLKSCHIFSSWLRSSCTSFAFFPTICLILCLDFIVYLELS